MTDHKSSCQSTAVGRKATVCKTVRRMLSDRCLSVCPVCDVRALWPNGWTDQDETWHDTLGFILSQLHLLNARLTLLNVLSIVHSTQFLGKLDELPKMK